MIKKWKHAPRFPRLRLDRDMKLAERILRSTYNSLAKDRVHWDGYDLYRTRMGLFAPHKFSLLGMLLVEEKIDPALYVKVLARYGKYARSAYLPRAQWLASKEAIEVFKWVLRKEKNKYPYHHDFKKAFGIKLGSKDERYIYSALKQSALMVRDVRKAYHLKIIEAAGLLKSEISPWYWAIIIPSIKRETAEEVLEWLVSEEKRLKTQIMRCTRFYVLNKEAWIRGKQIVRRYL